MSNIEIKKLIKIVGINLITVNVIWSGLLPIYSLSPIYYNFSFYGHKYSFNMINIVTWLRVFLTIGFMYEINNA